MLLAIGNDGQFRRFCEAAGQPQWAQDARYATNTLRVKHRGDLIPAMEAVTRTRTTADWIALLEDKAVPCGPINDIGQAFDDAQVKARGLALSQPRDAGDGISAIRTVASPMRLSGTPADYRVPPPLLGEHSEEVLSGLLGMTAAQIAASHCPEAQSSNCVPPASVGSLATSPVRARRT
jgi:formyl-CoA transferase